MSVLIDNYNKLYPAFAAKLINSKCVIAEQEAEDAQHTFRTLTIKGISGWMFPHDLPKQATSFYDKSQNGMSDNQKELPYYNILRKDCDGIFCIEENNKIVIYVCELKSSYTIDAVNKAKDQIVGVEGSIELAEAILNAHCHIYEQYGHGVYDESNDFQKRVLDFLK